MKSDQEILSKYACLLLDYSLNLKKGNKLYVTTTLLAEPLVSELYKACCIRGILMEYHFAMKDMSSFLIKNGTENVVEHVPVFQSLAIETFDGYLVIRAPYEDEKMEENDNQNKRRAALKPMNLRYNQRTTEGSLKRCLCQYPTLQGAMDASMSLEEYSHFIFNACKLYSEDAMASWKELGSTQAYLVEYLNQCKMIRYQNARTNVTFSVAGRTWINSDGKANMPSGEVYTGPVEDSVNGEVFFDYPSIYQGQEVRGVSLKIENGNVVEWNAEYGKEHLDKILQIEGTKRFGEVAIGTNYDIQRPTKNILFDEKIGGTIHMAIGQSYPITGGKNESDVHWDMIADMTQGSIYADGTKIYENGKFII